MKFYDHRLTGEAHFPAGYYAPICVHRYRFSLRNSHTFNMEKVLEACIYKGKRPAVECGRNPPRNSPKIRHLQPVVPFVLWASVTGKQYASSFAYCFKKIQFGTEDLTQTRQVPAESVCPFYDLQGQAKPARILTMRFFRSPRSGCLGNRKRHCVQQGSGFALSAILVP